MAIGKLRSDLSFLFQILYASVMTGGFATVAFDVASDSVTFTDSYFAGEDIDPSTYPI
jgi:hypothetical protein